MLLPIPKVVDITDRVCLEHLPQGDCVLIQIVRPEIFTVDVKAVQMPVSLTHSLLDDEMKAVKVQLLCHDHLTPFEVWSREMRRYRGIAG